MDVEGHKTETVEVEPSVFRPRTDLTETPEKKGTV